MSVKIDTVKAHALSSPIDPPQERPYHGGVRHILKRDFVLVVLEMADGLRGYAPGGASSSAMREFFENTTQDSFADIIEGPVADALEKEEFGDIGDAIRILNKLDLPTLPKSQAISAIDVALHDILGKRRGVPIYELLGEERNQMSTLTLYASAGMYMSSEEYARQAETLSELGFFGYKYRPGIGPEADRRTVQEIRRAVGSDTEIMVDAHTWWKLGEDSYTTDQLDRIVETYEENDVYWLEEPVQPDDYENYADIDKRTTLSIAGGESEHSPQGLLQLAETGAVDFLQGDVRHHRGFTGCLRVAEWCQNNHVQFVPHQFGTLLGLVANAHLVAAAPETELLEYPVFEDDPTLATESDPGMYPYPLAFDVLEDELDISDGNLSVPDGPGLGVDINMDVLERYEYIEGAWSTFSTD